MPARFVVVPQWQGSSSSRSMRLIDGAEAIRGDLPGGATTQVEVPLGAGDAVGTGVLRYSALHAVRDRLREALRRLPADATPVVVGGDCSVELAAVEHALRRQPDLAVVWFDAHADLHTAASSPTGAFHGMVARALLGEGPEGLSADPALAADRLLLAGLRACDPAEDAVIESAGVRTIAADAFADAAAVADAVAATGAGAVYLHVDLDVLDPEEIGGVGFPEPFGPSTARVTDAIRALGERFRIVGAGLTGFAPAGPDQAQSDLPAILRILSALTASSRTPRPD